MRWAHVVAGLIIASTPASAQTFGPTTYCAGGAAGLCFAAQFTYAPDLFTVYLRNLDGTGLGGSYGINQLFITRDNTIGAPVPEWNELLVGGSNPLGTLVGNVAVGPNTLVDRDDCGWAGCTSAFFQYQQFGVIGCSPTDYDVQWAFQTCASKGSDGWVRYDFDLYVTRPGEDHGIAADDFTFGLGGDGFACRWVGGQIADPTTCAAVSDPTVSPEPATLALVAPALLALGLRRRRVRC